jgi:biotin synthase
MNRVDSTILRVARDVLDGGVPSRDELLECAQSGAAESHYQLLGCAHQIRTKHFANTVILCSIGAGKLGACSEDCKWCAQSAAFSPGRTRPELTPAGDLVAAARSAAENRASSFGIVNSGRRPGQSDFQAVIEAVGEIGRNVGGPMRLCASLGSLSAAQAAQLTAAGVTRYNHNLETSERMYGRMVTTHSYQDRIETLQTARDAGLGLCAGGIFGIGETWEDRIDMGLTLRDEIRPDVVPLNFLTPIPGTPLAGTEPLSAREILSIIAMYRLILPATDIKIAGGREVNLRDMQSWIFYAGATSILVGNYLTTAGRSADDDLTMISDLGLQIVDS